MQYIPKGTPMHENLSTSFVRVEALFDELRTQGFSGYVLLNFPHSTGYIYLGKGQILNAIEESQQDKTAGRTLSEQLMRQASQTRGTISIYSLQPEAVIALAGIANGQLVYENLTSDFASLGKLIKKVSRERKLCFINLAFLDQPKEGGLVYIEGERVDVFCTTPQGDLTGAQALQHLVTQSEGRQAAFSLYRAKGADLPAFDEKEVESSLNRLTQGLPKAVPPAPPAPSQTASASSSAAAGTSSLGTGALSNASGTAEVTSYAKPSADLTNGVTLYQPNPTEHEDILDVAEQADSDAGISTSQPPTSPTPVATSRLASGASASPSLSPVASPVTLPETRHTEDDMGDLTGLMSQVIAAVERGMTVAGRGSSFPTALRAGLLAVTEQFPFLDPFAAEFEYHDREIVFVGSAQPDEFARGLTEALRQMVEDLIYSSNGRVRDYIAEELGKVERERTADLNRFGLENITRQICQN